MCGPEAHLFTPLLQFYKGPISSKRVSSQDPLFRKFGNFSLYSLNFRANFSSQAPKFGNFQLTSPRILEIFSSQAPKFGNFQLTSPPPPFNREVSVRKPHTSEIRAAHPYLKKSWVPRGNALLLMLQPWTSQWFILTQRTQNLVLVSRNMH